MKRKVEEIVKFVFAIACITLEDSDYVLMTSRFS